MSFVFYKYKLYRYSYTLDMSMLAFANINYLVNNRMKLLFRYN